MSPYLLSDHAEIDLLEVCDYLDQRSRSAASNWEKNILEAFDQLARHPLAAAARPELIGGQLRILPVEEYVIIFDPKTEPIRILAILHGARDIPAILRQREGNHARQI